MADHKADPICRPDDLDVTGGVSGMYSFYLQDFPEISRCGSGDVGGDFTIQISGIFVHCSGYDGLEQCSLFLSFFQMENGRDGGCDQIFYTAAQACPDHNFRNWNSIDDGRDYLCSPGAGTCRAV